jgi:hypothetical protein
MRKFMDKSRFVDANDWANYVLEGVDMDAVAKALDQLGWMIVSQPQFEPGRWPVRQPDCPAWADDPDAPRQPPRPSLQLIEGDKKDDGDT